MKFQVITLFPKMIEDQFTEGVVGQARAKGLIEIQCINPRTFTDDVHHTVDDRPFGGGDGMIMMAEPLKKSLDSIQSFKGKKNRVIYLSPQGKPFSDSRAKALSREGAVVLLCGRYGGLDQRFINEYVDEEISIGDYVLSGGELAACVVIDAVARHIPQVLGHGASASDDSFSEGFLEHPNFTRPREWLNLGVPEVLFSGHHSQISKWKKMVGQLVTLKKRPDLFWLHVKPEELPVLQNFYSQMSLVEKKSIGLEGVNFNFEINSEEVKK